ncbi:DOPA 4,5-dioxygenase family protein [Photobacterium sp. WH77]|uniref:DOPA 4,5-dioxygenase family protein n=1 Tax=unclassified Photobacterium TaxID=2628852 RepID=UPI001EDA0E05|nr:MULTISPECIES: DOPA 4,5-dioxygenase family protein [unclassified Photobacterium]MCG2837299.1 DOPA 4,5-dioxygenase family protein [Photobacterium sp. WH77]MCG2844915.1 DOPA 4,5-dioxygenase family protein [Photobacterium sp. WH80]MDO6583398.1 DOPA 4,5-dioxygenase family protein [Photobacterium sp. 2_MG-2023]
MFHAHVYFDLPQLDLAEQVRQRIIAERKADILAIYPLVPRLVGPHDKPMFEMHFADNQTGFIDWLDQHREGLSVLIHPVSENELNDHTIHARWLGKQLPVHTEIFTAQR